MADKKTYVNLTSPAGELARFACVTKPDQKYDHYKVGLILDDGKPARAFIKKLEKVRDDYAKTLTPAKLKKLNKAEVYEEEVDDAGEDTGRLIINFKSKQQPSVFDAAKPPNKLDLAKEPWGGSKVKVAGAFCGYDMPATKLYGTTKYLNALQIIELVEGGRDAAAYGFGDEDGGFDGGDHDDAPFESDDSDDADGEDDDF